MFVYKDVFAEYKPVVARVGDSAKADNGSFEIFREGNVVQRYQVEGRERDITFTRALHTPALNANLISVSTSIRPASLQPLATIRGSSRSPMEVLS